MTHLISKLKGSIQLKLIVAVILVTSIIQGSFSAIRIINEKDSALKQLKINQDRITSELSRALSDPLWNLDIAHAKTLAKLKLIEPDLFGIVVHDVIAHKTLFGLIEQDGQLIEHLNPNPANAIRVTIDIKKDQHVFWQAECYFTDTYIQDLILRNIHYTIFSILVLTSFLTVLLSLTLNVMIVTPIQHTTKMLVNIGEGDFAKRIIVNQNDEIGNIGKQVNELMDQWQSAIRELNRVIGAMARGDLSQKIVVPLKGDLDMLKRSVNQSIAVLSERTDQLKIAQQKLVDKAHQAGMADIASGTLHNIGNILNSVKVSAQLVTADLQNLNIESFSKANQLLRENFDDLEGFIVNNPKGKKLMEYYLKLEEIMTEESQLLKSNVDRLNLKIDIISDVIHAQQNYAGINSLIEEYPLESIIEDALTLQSGSIEHYHIKVIKHIEPLPLIPIQKTKLVHILINLIKNAKESMLETAIENRKLIISVTRVDNHAHIRIQDTGTGIAPENLKKIFTHGFSTKQGGHGFGLHSCANYMAEMNGRIWAETNPNQRGATFVLELNIPPEETFLQ